MSQVVEKLYTKCGRAGDVCRDKSTRGGLSSWCQGCRNAKFRAWSGTHPENGRRRVKRYRGRHLEQVHVFSVTRDGTHTQGNVVSAYRGCNSRKGDRPVWVTINVLSINHQAGSL